MRAARGVVGTWFDADFDPFGPCGPTAFWKLGDRQPSADSDRVSGEQSVEGEETEDEEMMHSHDWFPLLEGAGGLSLDPDEWGDDDFVGSDSSDDEGGVFDGFEGGGVQVVVGGMGGIEVLFAPADTD